MSTFTATLFIEPNPFSPREKVACGLLAVTPQRVFFKWADAKVKIAEGMADDTYRGYFQQRLRMLSKSLNEEDKNRDPRSAGLFHGLLSSAHFERLEQYNAGPVQFGDVKPYANDLDEAVYAKLFKEIVHASAAKAKRSGSGLYWAVHNKLDRDVIHARADVDYHLPNDRIPGLVYDAKLSMITVNGSIQAMQAVDMSKSLQTVTKHLNESEMIFHQLVKLGVEKQKPVDRLKLIYTTDGDSAETDLVAKVRNEKSDVFELVPLSGLGPKLEQIEKDPKYQRFSEFLEI